MAEIPEKLERIHHLVEARNIIRELYFNYDELLDDEVEKKLDELQAKVQVVRAQVQKRRSERGKPSGPPTPPTP